MPQIDRRRAVVHPRQTEGETAFTEAAMKVLILFVAWLILLALSWPLAILALVIAPLVWLIALPFRLLGVVVGATFALIRSLVFLPARILGHRGT